MAPGAPVPIMRRQEFAEASKERFYTEGAFYIQLETSFLKDMESYLKGGLGVKALIVGTNDHTYWIPGQPLLRSTSQLDVIDAHAYWQHPAISGWRNTPIVDDPLHSIMVKLTRSAMVGKPFTVSESRRRRSPARRGPWASGSAGTWRPAGRFRSARSPPPPT